MIHLEPVTLEGHGVRLEPMTADHAEGIKEAASDGELWKLWYTAVPEPEKTGTYIQTALDGQKDGHMLPWVVRELTTNRIAGSPTAAPLRSSTGIPYASVSTPGSHR